MASVAARRPRAVAAGATRLRDAVLGGPGEAPATSGRRRRSGDASLLLLLPPNGSSQEVCESR